MTVTDFLEKVRSNANNIQFQEAMVCIDTHYQFTPTAFSVGTNQNESGQNLGSLKVLAFAQLHQLNEEQTLHLFGEFYRVDVLQNPAGNDHQNIRNFIEYGWDGVKFEQQVLTEK